MNKKILCENIKKYRVLYKMTQAELAEKLDVPFQSVSQWERGIRTPKIETIEHISIAFGVSPYKLLDGVFEKGGD